MILPEKKTGNNISTIDFDTHKQSTFNSFLSEKKPINIEKMRYKILIYSHIHNIAIVSFHFVSFQRNDSVVFFIASFSLIVLLI